MKNEAKMKGTWVEGRRRPAGSTGDGAHGGDASNTSGESLAPVPVKCQCKGLCVQKTPDCKLLHMVAELDLWLTFCQALTFSDQESEDVAHQYLRDAKKGTITITHRCCKGTVSTVGNERPVCDMCSSLANDRVVVKNVGKFYLKYIAARMLAAKLFNIDLVASIEEEYLASAVFIYGYKDKLLDVSAKCLPALQRFVRKQFLSIPKHKRCRTLIDFIEGTIQPCLAVVPQACDPRLSGQAAKLATHLQKGTLNTISQVELKLAAAVAAGSLRDHPCIQGILCAAVEQAQRAKRGVFTMRNPQLSEVELSLMAQAGVVISAAGGNKHLLQQFGLQFTQASLPIHDLSSHSIPDFYMAAKTACQLQDNSVLIDCALRPVKQTSQKIQKDDENADSQASKARTLTCSYL